MRNKGPHTSRTSSNTYCWDGEMRRAFNTHWEMRNAYTILVERNKTLAISGVFGKIYKSESSNGGEVRCEQDSADLK